jgi:hypothetical protein
MATAEMDRIQQLEAQLRDKEELLQGGVQYAHRCGEMIHDLTERLERADALIHHLEDEVRKWKIAATSMVQAMQIVEAMDEDEREAPPK